MKRILLACVLAAEFSAADAQLYTFPAAPMTVADCQGGRIWMKRNGLATCDFYVPDPPPPPPPPPKPACMYDPFKYLITIGDMGQCTADGGCEGKGYTIVWDGRIVGSQMWSGYMDWLDLGPMATAGIDASAYRIGAIKANYPSNGNNMGLQMYEICPK